MADRSSDLPPPVLRLLSLASAHPGTLNARQEHLGAACRAGIRLHGREHGFADGARPFALRTRAGVLAALDAAIDAAAELPIAADGPGSRASMIDYVTDVLRQRTIPNPDTSAERLAEGIVTSILHRLGASYSTAAGATTRDHAGLGLLCSPCGGPCMVDEEPEISAGLRPPDAHMPSLIKVVDVDSVRSEPVVFGTGDVA